MIKTAAEKTSRVSVGLEERDGGFIHVHSLGLTGCIMGGADRDEALAAFLTDLTEWLGFMAESGRTTPSSDQEIEICVDEWIRVEETSATGPIACFDADREPLQRAEIITALDLLGSLRGRLLPHIRRMKNQDLERVTGPEYSLRTILEELARAQWWTLTRLGASPLAAVPDQVVARLDTATALTVDRLTKLPEEWLDVNLVLEDEEWTPRKVLRRLLWLEWNLGRIALGTIAYAEAGTR